jgi:hypothetical protein
MVLGAWAVAMAGTVCPGLVESSEGQARIYTDPSGKVLVRGSEDAQHLRHGLWTWYGPEGEVLETVTFEHGEAQLDAAWGPALDLRSLGITGRVEDKLEVLDIRGGWVAFRLRTGWVEALADGKKPVDCKYPGMAAYPMQGVTLGVYELATHEVASFEVYGRPPRDEAKCTPEALAKARLTAAKSRFAELGLATDRLPVVQLGVGSPTDQTFAGSPEIRITTSPTRGCIYLDPHTLALEEHEIGVRAWVAGKPWFWGETWASPANASGGAMSLLGVWREEQGAIVGVVADELPAWRHWLLVQTSSRK